MNSTNNSTLISTTAIIAGVVVFSFANASFTAAIPVEILLSIGASLGLLSIAAADYGRTNRRLMPMAALIRPIWNISPAGTTRATNANSSNSDRLAA